jgi:hypothetical protein
VQKNAQSQTRVSSFLNKFRKLGLIDYNGGLQVNSSLLIMVLRDQTQPTFFCKNLLECSVGNRLALSAMIWYALVIII